jgi:hypothetical protein
LREHRYVSSYKYKEFGFRLTAPLSAGKNMFDALLQRGVNLHDAYVMEISINNDAPLTFAVYREMQEFAPPIIKRILDARVMQLSKQEGEKSSRRGAQQEAEAGAWTVRKKRGSGVVGQYRRREGGGEGRERMIETG